MSNIEIMTQATKLYSEWEAAGSPGFWLEFYTARTGFDIGSSQYELVNEMTQDGLL